MKDMGHCSCCAHECASEKEVEVKIFIFQEYWKAGLSFILLISGIIMNALDFAFFHKEYVAVFCYPYSVRIIIWMLHCFCYDSKFVLKITSFRLVI